MSFATVSQIDIFIGNEYKEPARHKDSQSTCQRYTLAPNAGIQPFGEMLAPLCY
ncbi:MAG: hypothetical protein ABIU77_03380 [Ferruginibacter sp.]